MKKLLVNFSAVWLGGVFLASCSQSEKVIEAVPAVVNEIDKTCVPNKFDFLRLDVHTFDQDQNKGWRKVAQSEGCLLSAAALISEYRNIIIAENLSGLTWHEAQLRANAGETVQAISLFKQTHIHKEALLDNILYRDATIAFLERDKKTLLSARNALARIQEPENFKQGVEKFKTQYPDFPPPAWPPNLDVVDGFMACFDKSYKEAYGASCRP